MMLYTVIMCGYMIVVCLHIWIWIICIYIYIYIHICVAGWRYAYPSEKYEFVNWDDEIPNIWKNKSHVPNHQPVQHPKIGGETRPIWMDLPAMIIETPAPSSMLSRLEEVLKTGQTWDVSWGSPQGGRQCLRSTPHFNGKRHDFHDMWAVETKSRTLIPSHRFTKIPLLDHLDNENP